MIPYLTPGYSLDDEDFEWPELESEVCACGRQLVILTDGRAYCPKCDLPGAIDTYLETEDDGGSADL